ncbi:MAG: transposase [Anaerovoracaceae bacterium]
MKNYGKEFKAEALKLSDEIGVKRACSSLGIPYNTLSQWRSKRSNFGDRAFVGQGRKRGEKLDTERERQLYAENERLRQVNEELGTANEILKDALGFFAKDRKK